MSKGNEKRLTRLIVQNRSSLKLPHIGSVRKIETPTHSGFKELKSDSDIEFYVKPDSSKKKADIYINGNGISLKQTGGSKAFNKFYRKNACSFFQLLGYEDIDKKIEAMDHIVKLRHDGSILRNYPWQKIFSEKDFKAMMFHLMMKGNLHSLSGFPADYILTAPKEPTIDSITFYNFDEYFEAKKDLTTLAIRPCWTNQKGKVKNQGSEATRAIGLAKHKDNQAWIFDTIVGKPRFGFNDNPVKKTCYYFDLEVKD